MQSLHGISNKRGGHGIRSNSKSPVASASAFESQEGSEEEDNLLNDSKLDNAYLHANGITVSSFMCSLL